MEFTVIFRYPGSKAKLCEYILSHMDSMIEDEFNEPFVGGGSVLCAVAEKYPKIRMFANDQDRNISSFWELISRNKPKEIKSLIEKLAVTPTVDLFKKLKNDTPKTIIDRAYIAVFFNRTTFSGIAKASPIGGFSQKSKWKIDCRYNFNLMAKNIKKMCELFDRRLMVTNDCALNCLTEKAMYLDPPYVEKGDMLYSVTMDMKTHVGLSIKLKNYQRWVLSYDDCPEINHLYSWADISHIDKRYSISGKKRDWAKKRELIIQYPLKIKNAMRLTP